MKDFKDDSFETNKLKLTSKVENYYSQKIKKYGATSKGVDWNGKQSHELRFKQLSKVIDAESNFSILDYGSGYGSLIDFLNQKYSDYYYIGYDISEEMITQGKLLHQKENIRFTSNLNDLTKANFVIANGIFNVKLDTPNDDWKTYAFKTIKHINELALNGFSFNILTSYSDKEYMKDYLYYANPLDFFDFCKKEISKNVALLHDYDLYEFTIIVKK